MTAIQLTKEQAIGEFKTILDRYNKYKDNKEFISNEKQICESLIKPFVQKVLGWDIEDPSEFKVEYPERGKRIDMLICLDSISQFIIEAKSLTKEIINNNEFYIQAINYAHSKEREFAILTNFKYWIVLRCDIKVEFPQRAVIDIVDLTNLKENQFDDFIWNFNKELWVKLGNKNLLYSKLDNLKKKQPIDEQLLEDMKKWRISILTNLRKYPRKNNFDFENERELLRIEEEIQRFIGRLIFICYCEDKGLNEPKLKSYKIDKFERFDGKPFLLKKILELFYDYRNEYNSDLFCVGPCDGFYFEDSILYDILTDLREPECKMPYDFACIEVDILGKTYENFIGHLIKGKKRFKEEKSNGIRKEQGIYYTPQYIVNYIVNNTVREYIKDKSYEEIKKVKILDPACGSGSFLIRVFDVLIEECSKKLKRGLTYEEKTALLLGCIYGVDKDERACDIAKLNLSLKLAEKNKKLPELYNNIKNGDSLIDDASIVEKYLAFDWNKQFEKIMDNDGFDIVIGNPPYVDIKQLEPKIVKHFFDKYSTVENRMNLYAVFIERALSLLKEGGYFGFIIPNSILYNESYQKMRALLLDKVTFRKIIRLPDNVFQNVKVETIILTFQKKKETTKKPNCEVIIYPRETIINAITKENNVQVADFNQKIWETENKVINISTNTFLIKLLNKIEEETKLLVDICDVSLGLTPYDKYKGHTKSQITERVFHYKTKKNATFKPLLSGENIIRYGVFWDSKEYISYGNWLGASREKRFFINPRIIVRQIISGKPQRIYAGYTEEEFYNTQIAFNILIKDETKISLKYLLAVFNSKLMNFYHKERFLDQSKNLFQKILIANAKKFPIKILSLEKQQPLIKLVDKMLLFNKHLNEIGDKKTDERIRIKEEIKKTDTEIDELVYKIYGITIEEKKIIEDSLI